MKEFQSCHCVDAMPLRFQPLDCQPANPIPRHPDSRRWTVFLLGLAGFDRIGSCCSRRSISIVHSEFLLTTYDVMGCCLVASFLYYRSRGHVDGESSLPSILPSYPGSTRRDRCQIDRDTCQIARHPCQIDSGRCQIDRDLPEIPVKLREVRNCLH